MEATAGGATVATAPKLRRFGRGVVPATEERTSSRRREGAWRS